MTHSWTQQKVDALELAGLRNLRNNAQERGAEDVVAMCDAALGSRAKSAKPVTRKPRTTIAQPKRVSRKKAMEMRGVKLHNPMWSWGGIRESDGVPVLCLWASEITRTDEGAESMIWGENIDGSRPWADSNGGKERLRHCEVAVEKGGGEGVVIYGQISGVDLPAYKPSKVEGVDPDLVIRFKVEKRGGDYWAVWDKAGEGSMQDA